MALPQTDTGYTPGTANTINAPGAADQGVSDVQYWSLAKCKRSVTDYLGSKREEIDEQKLARKYYHGTHYTSAQLKTLRDRNQPAMTFNRIARKIDGVVGLIERLRQDPKAFPRTPKHEQGAELATAVIRYVLDSNEWSAKSPEVARDGAIDGISGVEVTLKRGDRGDIDIGLEIVEPDTFIYDPRSNREDFSDARYMGVSKWYDVDEAKDMFPDMADQIEADSDANNELTTQSDRENRWFASDGVTSWVRIVDLWYQHKGGWCYSVFTGSTVLQSGQSWLRDAAGNQGCKFIMFSASVDQDGDRYAFTRNMKSAQDGINAKQSKMQHILASRRLVLTNGAVQDIEVTRKEWARPDGVIIVNPGGEVKPDDQSFDFAGWSKLLELNLAEIENFGPNPALIGQGIENRSGRAIALLQQAGIAELGPYILSYKGWKLRVYRAVWMAVQQHWQGERWVRVTDDDQVAQFIQINGLGIDPQTGMPTIVNAVGSIDVDIIIDESADYVNMQADAYDTLTTLAQQGSQVPPDVLIELSPLTYSVKQKIQERLQQAAQQPNPAVAMKQQELALKQQDSQASMQLEMAKAQQAAQLKEQEAQTNLAIRAKESQQQAELKQQELFANLEMKRQETAAEIALEREKANAQIMIARDTANARAAAMNRTSHDTREAAGG